MKIKLFELFRNETGRIANAFLERCVWRRVEASNGAPKIKFNLGGTRAINAININSAVSDDVVQIATGADYHGFATGEVARNRYEGFEFRGAAKPRSRIAGASAS